MANGDTAAATSCKPRAQKTNSNGSNSIRVNNPRLRYVRGISSCQLSRFMQVENPSLYGRHVGKTPEVNWYLTNTLKRCSRDRFNLLLSEVYKFVGCTVWNSWRHWVSGLVVVKNRTQISDVDLPSAGPNHQCLARRINVKVANMVFIDELMYLLARTYAIHIHRLKI